MKKIFIITLLSVSFFCAESGGEILPVYDLIVSFDVNKNLLKGRAKIILPEGQTAIINTGGLSVKYIKINGTILHESAMEFQSSGTVEISYEGIFEKSGEDIANAGVVSGDVINSQGISLTGKWYPELDGLAYYNLKAVVPDGFNAVSEAEEIAVKRIPEGVEYDFNFPYPLNGVNLVASRYKVEKEYFEGIEISAYFFPEDISIAGSYIEHSKKYLKMYGELLRPYPYKRFSVVENFLPTGYSMPTFTTLGRSVVKLPFIVETSLGHEILHQWFGNFVYVDCEDGNWSEGLTSYLSDLFYKEQEGMGWQYRKKLLVDYRNYVNAGNEIPLREFISRKDFATKAIGYGKGAMFFHMLKKYIGDEMFYRALKDLIEELKFRRVSWSDIMEEFVKTSGMELDWFFEQWISDKGLPQIEIEDPRMIILKGVPTVSFYLKQKGKPYRFILPVKVVTDRGSFVSRLNIEKKKEFIEIKVHGTPIELVLDCEYDVMRKISDDECPPAISGILSGNNRLLVVNDGHKEVYAGMVELLKTKGFNVINEKDVRDKNIMESSLLIIGKDSPVFYRLFGKSLPDADTGTDSYFSLTVRKNPLNNYKVVAVADGSPKQVAALLPKKMFHYGEYSKISFRDGSIVLKETAASDRGIRQSIYTPVRGIRPEKTLTLEEIIRCIIDVPIIYAGEGHTLYEDHMVQLQVIRGLYESGHKFAIGMEMFQRPYQQSLDDYLSGKLTEKEFLKSSEYYKRWNYNYFLYKEIMDFALANRIPVIALNQKEEIIKKVSKNGIDSLTEEERKDIPEDMDMSDEEYKKRLENVFSQHGSGMSMNHDNFYQAQILWDETMAHTINNYLKNNPDQQMVVIAGSGHIAYGSGIPKRVYRLNRKNYVTLLNAKADSPITGLADYVLFPEPMSSQSSPVLGILIDKEDEKVKIKGVSIGSLAGKAGLKSGDILLSVDDMEIRDVDDVRIALFDKKEGDIVKVKVLRGRFLLKDKKLEIRIAMP